MRRQSWPCLNRTFHKSNTRIIWTLSGPIRNVIRERILTRPEALLPVLTHRDARAPEISGKATAVMGTLVQVCADQGGVGFVPALAHDGVVSVDQRSTVHGSRSECEWSGVARCRGSQSGSAGLEAQIAAVASRARRKGDFQIGLSLALCTKRGPTPLPLLTTLFTFAASP